MVDLTRAPAEVAHALGQQWCREGGELFVAPGETPEEDWIEVLESCAEMDTGVGDEATSGEVTAAILEIGASYYESREVLLYQHGPASHLLELHHEQDDTSGENDAVWTRSYDSVELRDVHGDAAPEWIATITTSGGDSFEAGDRCYSEDQTLTELMICTNEPAGLRCLSVPITDYLTIDPRPVDELYDCEDHPPAGTPTQRHGYVGTVAVERGVVVFTPLSGPAMDEPEDPSYQGRVPIETLFEGEAFEPITDE